MIVVTLECMRAAVCTRYGPPEVLQQREIEKPVPRAGEVCVRIYATTVTSSDCFVRSGKVDALYWLPMRLALGFTGPRNPVLGMVFAGEVDSAGRDVKSLKKGDRVFGFDRFGFGTYAEYKRYPESGVLAIMPCQPELRGSRSDPLRGADGAAFPRRGKSVADKEFSSTELRERSALRPCSWPGTSGRRSPGYAARRTWIW